MALKPTYPPDFERVWTAYPSWPKGRSVKQLAFKKFQALKKQFGWEAAEIDQLILEIEKQKRDRASWQEGDKYGPQGLQVWLNQHGWEHDYPRKKDERQVDSRRQSLNPWDIRGISKAEWEAEQSWLAREGLKMPQDYETKEAAMAAARLQEMSNGIRH
jgi:hypothetical protein